MLFSSSNNLNIYSGNDDQIIPILSLGGLGVISVVSNIMPKYTFKMINKYMNNEIAEASRMQIKISNLIELLFKEVNPIPVKEALNILGFKVGKPRLPLVECTNELRENLIKEINYLKKEIM